MKLGCLEPVYLTQIRKEMKNRKKNEDTNQNKKDKKEEDGQEEKFKIKNCFFKKNELIKNRKK